MTAGIMTKRYFYSVCQSVKVGGHTVIFTAEYFLCTENALATVDSEPEVRYDNHCDQALHNGRKTVKETPI